MQEVINSAVDVEALSAMDEALLLGIDVLYVLLGIALLFVAKQLQDWLTPYSLDVELRDHDNPALGLALCGYFVAVISIFIGAALGDDFVAVPSLMELSQVLAEDLAYALAGILVLHIGRLVVDHLILHRFSVTKEIIEDRNVGTGAVEAGALVATGLIVAGAINGTGGGPWTALMFFVVGQLALVIYARCYDWMTSYDLHVEIECDNVAAGTAFGASLVAFGVILLKASSGPFEDWITNLSDFCLYAVLGFLLLLVLRKVADALFLPGVSLDAEIADDRNLCAAWLEGTVAIGIAVMLFALL